MKKPSIQGRPQSQIQSAFSDEITSTLKKLGTMGGAELVYLLASEGPESEGFKSAVKFYSPRLKSLLEVARTCAPDLETILNGSAFLPAESNSSGVRLLKTHYEEKKGGIKDNSTKDRDKRNEKSGKGEYLVLRDFVRTEGIKTTKMWECTKYLVRKIKEDPELMKYAQKRASGFGISSSAESLSRFRELIAEYRTASTRQGPNNSISKSKTRDNLGGNGVEYTSLSNFLVILGIPVKKRKEAGEYISQRISTDSTPLTKLALPRTGGYQIQNTPEAKKHGLELLSLIGIEIRSEDERKDYSRISKTNPDNNKPSEITTGRSLSAKEIFESYEVPTKFTEYATKGSLIPGGNPMAGPSGINLYSTAQASALSDLWCGEEGQKFRNGQIK